jgi:capsular exopolysaccharide synthesis family protein
MSSSITKRSIITDVNPKSPISEAYRTLRTNLDFSSIDEQLQVIMLTSAGPGEGKSTTAANLAVAYAQADKKVLLIDADLRKPTMHHIFEKTNRLGLTNVISGQQKVKDVILQTHIHNLSILTSGPIPPNPSEILASKRMNVLIEEMKLIYDMIIFDTPPALAVTDAQIVATKCDGVILVIDSGKVKREVVLKTKASLLQVQARILGAVLNNMERGIEGSYYYYYYGKEDKL